MPADPGPRFGPEFTFGNTETADHHAFIGRARTHLIDGQNPEAQFLNENGLFISPEGWDFTVVSDLGVAEVRMGPMTASDFRKYASNIQDAIFESAANVGMFPQLYLGGGHINVDVHYFAPKPPVLLRNFLVDRINHSEMALGIMNYDTNNSASYSMANSLRDGIRKVVAKFDEGFYGDIHYPSSETLATFLAELKKISAYDDIRVLWGHPNRTDKSSEISFQDSDPFKGQGRVEIRAVRPQASVDVWVRQIELIRDRIFFLERNFSGPIPFAPWYTLPTHQSVAPFKLIPPVAPLRAMQAFYVYVKESGHRWQDHRDYVWPQWTMRNSKRPLEPSELEKFEATAWFKEQEGLKTAPDLCAALLWHPPGR